MCVASCLTSLKAAKTAIAASCTVLDVMTVRDKEYPGQYSIFRISAGAMSTIYGSITA